MPEILRYAAFTDVPEGGNPAGVVLDAQGLDDAAMQSVAAEVGYSETAFVTPGAGGDGALRVRYFSPEAEVPFCGHATIATAVAHAERHGPATLRFETNAGVVGVDVVQAAGGALVATLTSVEPAVEDVDDATVERALAALRWARADLDGALPPRTAFAGARHLVLGAATRSRLASLEYDFDVLRVLMAEHDWTTVHLVWREDETVFHARDPFPPGGVVEDPATGAAAAAFGGYLRALALIAVPASLTIHQGVDLGRPSLLRVRVPERGGVEVSGGAVPIA